MVKVKGFFLSLLVSIVAVVTASSPLGPYKASDVTVSGISSGGYMAVQLHISYSSIVNGSAILAAGPFYCAEGSAVLAQQRCMATTMGAPNAASLARLTLTDENLGVIDSTKNLKDDKVYIFSGLYDSVVDAQVVNSLEEYYRFFVATQNIVSQYTMQAEHCWPTLDYGNECGTLSLPYIGKCGFDAAGASLRVLYGELKAPVAAVAANLQSFSQTPYIPSGIATSLGDTGYIYVPTACQNGASCKLHIALHGCLQTLANIGTAYAEHTGFNTWAESNNIIVLYPYADVSAHLPLNPNGCWDWWGYTGPLYGVQSGPQVKFLRNLIKAVTGN